MAKKATIVDTAHLSGDIHQALTRKFSKVSVNSNPTSLLLTRTISMGGGTDHLNQ